MGNRPAFLWIGEDFGCCASGRDNDGAYGQALNMGRDPSRFEGDLDASVELTF
jgi:hypothetical protein